MTSVIRKMLASVSPSARLEIPRIEDQVRVRDHLRLQERVCVGSIGCAPPADRRQFGLSLVARHAWREAAKDQQCRAS
jgi:hypothetical protein